MGAKTGLYFIDQSVTRAKITESARCITAKYNSGIVNHTAMNSGVLEAYPILTPERIKKRQNGRRVKEEGEPMFTLTESDRHGVAIRGETKKGYAGLRIRRLTPRECFRLQGFPDELYEKAAAVNSDTQLYRQAGNAVTVNVAYAVALTLAESSDLCV